MTFEYSAIPGLCAAELAEVERAVARYERDTKGAYMASHEEVFSGVEPKKRKKNLKYFKKKT